MSNIKKQRDTQMDIIAKSFEINDLIRGLDISEQKKRILFDKVVEFTIELRKI